MTIFTRDFNRNSSYWTAILFYLICGLLLLLMPNLALSIANVALAILLCAVGVRSIVSYLRGSILDGVMGLQLAAGLVALFNPLFLAELLPFVWGVALLVGGFGKVQMAADLKRIGDRFWWYALIAALLSFVLGALAITRPVFIAAVLTQFVGASLLVEGVLDLVSFLTLNKRIKKFRREMENHSRQ